ncbi:MAG: MATE family efflux transporter, partial [Caulobacterales bacterium]
LTPGWIASAYTVDPALRAVTGPLLLLAALMMVPDGLQVVSAGALRAHGVNWFPTVSHLASYLLVMIPLAIWLSWGLHRAAEGLVQAIILASVMSGTVLVLRVVWLAQTLRRAHG